MRKLIGIFSIVLCIFCGVTGCKGTESASDKKSGAGYMALAQNQEGEPLAGVALKLFNNEGKELVYVPEYSNSRGEVLFKAFTEKDCYVQVLETPTGYKLDDGKKHYFDKNNCVTVVLEEGINESDSNDEEEQFVGEYEATVNGVKYATLTEALKAVNKAGGDVTVLLNKDVSFDSEFIINNSGCINITIDGAGHTITTDVAENVFCINQPSSVVEFKNMKINHKATNSLMRSGAGNTINFTDVVIDTKGAKASNYSLFNLAGNGAHTTLNLTNVDVDMVIDTKGNTDAALIRTGNHGNDSAKTVEINIVNSKLDASGAVERTGIMIMDSTRATINIKNSTIKTGNAYPIRSNFQPMTLEKATLSSTVAEYQKEPIEDKGTIVSDNKNQEYSPAPVVKIGEKEYGSMVLALMDANEALTDVVVQLIADTTIGEVAVNNAANRNVTIDGGGHTITSEGRNNAISIEQEAGAVEIRNVKIVHKNTGAVVRHNGTCTVNLTDMKIDATQGEKYNYFLINLAAPVDTLYMNLNRVDIKMAVETAGGERSGIIRTGNGTVDDAKTVVLTMTDCNIDATGATGRTGLMIMPNTTAYVKMTNTTIKTKDIYAIRANRQNIEMYNCTIHCESAFFKNMLIEDDVHVIQKED